MNLIEQLGGYEKAKEWYAKETKRLSAKGLWSWDFSKLQNEMLQHRREHGIYEKDDLIVFDVTKPFCAQLQPDLMRVINPKYQEHDMVVMIDNQIYVVGGKAVRHAKDAEIKAKMRLEVGL